MESGRIWNLLFSAIVLLIPPFSYAENCHNRGILVDIHNRQVNGRLRYGLSIGLGSPSQDNSLWPAITSNETTFSAPDYCVEDSWHVCSDGARGFFSSKDSTTWRDVSPYDPLDDSSTYDNAVQHTGEDTLNILYTEEYGGPQTSHTVDHFPTVILSNYTSSRNSTTFYGPGGVVGLGSASSILTKLVEQDLISARTYGMYLGPGFDRSGNYISGSLVLGGYDAGRFDGPVAMYDQVPALPENLRSPFKITVEQVSLVTAGGETVMQFVDDSFDAYITTGLSPIQFPDAVTAELATALGATPANNKEGTLQLSKNFQGNLTITLSNNLTITFDSDWLTDNSLITPIAAASATSTTSSQNSSLSGLDRDDSSPVIFGAAFLARAYMFVNYDASPPNFGLAQALPDVTDIQQRPYCSDVPLIAASLNQGHSRASSRKALIGGVCGGLLGGLLALALIWVFCGSHIRKFLRRNDPRFNADNDSFCNRPGIKQKFSHWNSKIEKLAIWKQPNEGATYMYRDIESGQNAVPPALATMHATFDSEKDEPVPPILRPLYGLPNAGIPTSLSQYAQLDTEKSLMPDQHEVPHGSSSDAPSFKFPYYPVSSTISETWRSITNKGKTPKFISVFNPQVQQNDSQSQHTRNGSHTLTNVSLMDGLTFPSTKIPFAQIRDIPDRNVYDKSLPATPASSKPASLLSRLSRAMSQRTELDGTSSTTTPRIPSLAFTPTNITFKPPTTPIPPVPVIPAGFTNDDPSGRDASYSPVQTYYRIEQPAVDLLDTFQDTIPASASTTYSFWRNKQSRSLATSKSSTTRRTQAIGATEPSTPAELQPGERSQQPGQSRRTRTMTSTASSARSRVALAARLSRLRDLPQSSVREIMIRKRARSRSLSRTRAQIDLSIYEGAPITNHSLNDPSDINTRGFTIKRKAVPRSRAVSGISPCISVLGDELLGMSDRAISPVSSMGRGRGFDDDDDVPPPIPPFPSAMYIAPQ